MKKKIIAVFGGAFNPPTIAHIELAKQVLKEMKNIEKVIFVPVSTKYNKSGLASDEDRYQMLKAICDEEENLEVSSIELDSNRQLYTIETLEKMKDANPNNDIYFIIGTDNLKDLATWHTADKLLQEFKMIVLERDNDNINEIINKDSFLKQYKDSFIILNNINKINLSASFVRELVKKGESIHGMVPETIERRIIEIY